MYEVTYLGSNANYYHYYDIEADNKEDAREKFIAKTGIESWRIYDVIEVEEE